MLDVDLLSEQIAQGIRTTIIPAICRMEMQRAPIKNNQVRKECEAMAKAFDDIVTDRLAEIIAKSIDYYIKNGDIHGIIMTTGSPTIQFANVNSAIADTPVTKGVILNTLGIS